MKRGTTPTLTFGLPFSPELLAVAYITFAQQEETVLEKTLQDCEQGENSLKLTLSQEDTLKLEDGGRGVSIQLRVRFSDGSAMASDIITTDVGTILKDGVI